MKVLVAIDSFKGSISSAEAIEAVREGIMQAKKDAEVFTCLIADGGEGTEEAIYRAIGGEKVFVKVHDPLFRVIQGDFIICGIKTKKFAVIESARAIGITLVSEKEKNIEQATSYGLGELIEKALDLGVRDFCIGLGGSCTNDGGSGMLLALGAKLLDEYGNSIPLGGRGLEKLAKIDMSSFDKRIYESNFYIAADVKNPLCGENGCSRIFGPQKGGDESTLKRMDRWLYNYGTLASNVSKKDYMNQEGAGAAGGLGFAFLTFFNGKIKSGIDIIIEMTGMKEKIEACDIVVTGEGCIDKQTAMGKVPCGIAAYAKKYGKPVIAFCGCEGEGA